MHEILAGNQGFHVLLHVVATGKGLISCIACLLACGGGGLVTKVHVHAFINQWFVCIFIFTQYWWLEWASPSPAPKLYM